MIRFEEYRLKTKALIPLIDELSAAMDIENLEKKLAELQEQTEADNFWDNLELCKNIQRKIKAYSSKIEHIKSLRDRHEDLATLITLAIEEGDESIFCDIESEYALLLNDIEKSNLETLLSGEYDRNNAILSFQAGAGGTEAQDWAEMLYRLYTRWVERRGFKYKILNYIDGDGAGIKSADILIEGDNAFGYLKGEVGVHRLVRISPFDSSGRRHTSFAALEVLPELEEDMSIEISSDDLKVDTYRSSGAGGQHVNKTESAIRITHIPSGIVVACQTERSQHQNRENAMKMLKAKLLDIKEKQHLEKIGDIRGVQKKIEWGNQIRSYVFMPYTLVKDNRTGHECGNVSAVMDGDIDDFINAYLKMLATKEIT